ncbi:MAG: hypothetical protein JW755_14085 [Candidatus Aminicenantes bacterium]|nr:hypothetical protein [Candidatus Aminicenantes bacterium]
MDTKISDIKKEYTTYCIQKSAASRKNCLPPEKLLLLARGELPDKEKGNCLMHISNCIFCSRETKAILKILHYEKQMINEATRKRTKNQKSILGLSWRTAAFSGLLILIAISSFFVADRIMNSDSFRGENSPSLNLITPVDTYTSKPFPMFKWTEVQEAEYYILELYDEFLEPLWESSKIYTTEFRLPEEVVFSLRPNNDHYWMVTAYISSRKTVESSLKKFTFRRVYR